MREPPPNTAGVNMIENIITYFLVSVGSAFLGVWGGSTVWYKFKEKEKKRVRDLASLAIDKIIPYEKIGSGSYRGAKRVFNSTFNIAQKRAILVALHKLGLPIAIPAEGKFLIKDVNFLDEKINKCNLLDIQRQINSGYVDSLFFIDPDDYFNEDLRIKTLRNLAKRYVNEVMRYSHISEDGREAIFDINFYTIFSYFEANAILVFREKTLSDLYYKQDKTIDIEKLERIIVDIDSGLCDMYFNIDLVSYNNIVNQNKIASHYLSCMTSPLQQSLSQQNLLNKNNN